MHPLCRPVRKIHIGQGLRRRPAKWICSRRRSLFMFTRRLNGGLSLFPCHWQPDSSRLYFAPGTFRKQFSNSKLCQVSWSSLLLLWWTYFRLLKIWGALQLIVPINFLLRGLARPYGFFASNYQLWQEDVLFTSIYLNGPSWCSRSPLDADELVWWWWSQIGIRTISQPLASRLLNACIGRRPTSRGRKSRVGPFFGLFLAAGDPSTWERWSLAAILFPDNSIQLQDRSSSMCLFFYAFHHRWYCVGLKLCVAESEELTESNQNSH